MNKQALINILMAASFLVSLGISPHSRLVLYSSAAPAGSLTPSLNKSERHYTMNASVRLLLFWIGRENVGGGRIVWTEEPGRAKGLELLIGSDPDRAPRKINRWGYISEQVSGSSAQLIGIMTQSDEESIEQADANLTNSGNKHTFKAIRCRQNEAEAQSSTFTLHSTENFTYRDVAEVLDLIPRTGSSIHQLRIPPGTDPGFLFALREMLHNSVKEYRQSGHLRPKYPRRRQFVFNASLYDLSLISSRLLRNVAVNGRHYRELIESEFETRNITTGATSKFTISYGTDKQIPEVPVRIVYQPRWWFKAELLLDEDISIMQVAERVGER